MSTGEPCRPPERREPGPWRPGVWGEPLDASQATDQGRTGYDWPPVSEVDPSEATEPMVVPPRYTRASRAYTALRLSVFGLFCCGLTGVVGMFMGIAELLAIRGGETDPAYTTPARRAVLIGMGSFALWATIIGLWVLAVLSVLASRST